MGRKNASRVPIHFSFHLYQLLNLSRSVISCFSSFFTTGFKGLGLNSCLQCAAEKHNTTAVVNCSTFDWKESSKSSEPNLLFKQPNSIAKITGMLLSVFAMIHPSATSRRVVSRCSCPSLCQLLCQRLCFWVSWGIWVVKVSAQV